MGGLHHLGIFFSHNCFFEYQDKAAFKQYVEKLPLDLMISLYFEPIPWWIDRPVRINLGPLGICNFWFVNDYFFWHFKILSFRALPFVALWLVFLYLNKRCWFGNAVVILEPNINSYFHLTMSLAFLTLRPNSNVFFHLQKEFQPISFVQW